MSKLKEDCLWCQKATNPEYYSTVCNCGSIFGVHKAPHPHGYGTCESFTPETKAGSLSGLDCVCKEVGDCQAATHHCVCLDYGSAWCKADHSITLVEEGVIGIVKCPICRTDSYAYDDPPDICFCSDCDIEFRSGDGSIVQTHIAPFDPKDSIYKCTLCNFQTIDLKEKLKHEQEMPPMVLGSLSSWINKKAGEKKQSIVVTSTIEEKKDDPHYCIYNHGQGPKWKCKYCDWAGDSYVMHENAEGKRLNQYSGVTTTYSKPHCVHKPRHVIDGGDWGVWVGRKFDCEDEVKNYDIFLNLSGFRVSKRHELPRELRKWEGSIGKCQEYLLDWPDFGVVNLPKQFWVDLVNYLQKNKLKMLVCCIGGHGRTGTCAACLMVVGLGYTAAEACSWIWEQYCSEAIESQPQVSYIYHIAGEEMPKLKEPKKKGTPASFQTSGAWD